MIPDSGDQMEAKIARQVERLRGTALRSLEKATAAKRRLWLEQYGLAPHAARDGHRFSPREAFELFFYGYLGLAPEEIPVVSESDSEITWLSGNPCPTLEACGRLGLDTRAVCRAVYEKPTQAFFSVLDPELRFLRDYDAIRPHAPHCKERIERVDFAGHMRMALEEAALSRAGGNKGYGAVVAYGNEVLAHAHDTATSEGDPSLHAELKAIRQAVTANGSANLSGAVLYSTCEPCPMCTGLAVWANLTSIVYGASIAETAALGRSRITVSAAEIAAQAPCLLEVFGGVLREQCLALYVS